MSMEQLRGCPLLFVCPAAQLRVLHQVARAQPGLTLTYGEIARRSGMPRGARAVGRVMATNPFSGLIPCHRVVSANKKIGGYRWGVELKQHLLAQENQLS